MVLNFATKYYQKYITDELTVDILREAHLCSCWDILSTKVCVEETSFVFVFVQLQQPLQKHNENAGGLDVSSMSAVPWQPLSFVV
mmetsp:Transcript_21162/g.28145  ORF Transcript_21162/g.28145 Transcript_21162/m.28145 type:complete len:85 (+) Transcript_21162:400-654(+)